MSCTCIIKKSTTDLQYSATKGNRVETATGGILLFSAHTTRPQGLTTSLSFYNLESDRFSPPQTFDRVVDLRDNLVAQPVLGPSAGSHPSYMQTSQYDTRAFPATTSSSYTVPSSSYNTSPISRPEYSTYQNENSIATSRSQYSTSVSSAGSYGAADAGYYPSSNQMDYSSAGSQSGYYPTTDYYSTNGDPAVFVGATSGEYYYVEPDPDEVPSTRT